MNHKTLNLKILALVILVFQANGSDDHNQSKIPPIEKIGDFKFRFGGVLIDQKKRTVEFNATSNQINGLIEYALVHESGKTHESLFRTKVRPQIIHTCFLLLKHPMESRFFENLWAEKPKDLNFDKCRIKTEVIWEVNGTTISKSFEQLSVNTKNNISLENGAFIFTGSKEIEGAYLADMSGSIVAIYADEEAVINSSDHDSNNDDVWIANGKDMPELELPVIVRFLLPRRD